MCEVEIFAQHKLYDDNHNRKFFVKIRLWVCCLFKGKFKGKFHCTGYFIQCCCYFIKIKIKLKKILAIKPNETFNFRFFRIFNISQYFRGLFDFYVILYFLQFFYISFNAERKLLLIFASNSIFFLTHRRAREFAELVEMKPMEKRCLCEQIIGVGDKAEKSFQFRINM